MKEIEQIVNDYLTSDNSDYAIMINGDWGCGKTYYIKKSLFEKIKSIDSFIKGKKNVALKYEPLYVSLYGVSDISDVLYKIQLELNSWLKSKTWTIARTGINKLSPFSKVSVSKEDEKSFLSIFNIQKNRVLFFDDLERIDYDKLSISSVLGQINHFTEQDNLKVIIICNSTKTAGIFSEINEKTIRFSCEYNPRLEDVYDKMILDYKSSYIKFLKTHKQIIINIFSIAKYKNLRTLRFILDIFQKVYHQVKGNDYEEDILNRLLFFVTIYSVEYKNGHKRADLDTLVNVGPFSKMFSLDIERLMMPDKVEAKKEEPTYYQLFKEKYSDIIDSFNYSQEIAYYIQIGYLEEIKLQVEIIEIINEIKLNKVSEEEKLIKEIKNWRELSDESFKPLFERIMTKIDEGKFSLYAYPVIYAEFIQIEYFHVEDFEITKKLIERFKGGIDIAKQNHKFIEAFSYKIPIWSNRDTSKSREKYDIIGQYTIDANDFSLKKSYDDVIKTILKYFENNKSKELQDILSDHSHINYPIFEELDEKEIFSLLLKADSQTKAAFNWGLYGRYPENSINTFPAYQKEKAFFSKLQKLVEDYISLTKPVKISTVQFIDLNINLNRIKNLN